MNALFQNLATEAWPPMELPPWRDTSDWVTPAMEAFVNAWNKTDYAKEHSSFLSMADIMKKEV
jgi:hypothetical protein